MKICIVSDSHDRAPMLAAAVAEAKAAGAEAVVHCGDVIGANIRHLRWVTPSGE
jgi:predicted phosphodiesterase